MRSFRFLAVFVWVSIGSAAFAATAASVRAEVNKGFITIGETLIYTVLVRHGPDDKVLSRIEFPNPRDFEVKSRRDIPSKKEGDWIISGAKFEVTAFGLGEFIIDEVPVRFLLGAKEAQLKTNRIYITVESVDKSGKPKIDIRGIKAPLELPRNYKLVTVVSIAGVSILFLLTVFWVLRKRAGVSPASAAVALSPQEEAHQALNALFESSLLREGKLKEYYFRLSDIIRKYLQRRFNFPAVEETTGEIVKEMVKTGQEPAINRMVTEFLEELDLVKFAKYIPEPAEIVLINKRAGELVDRTKNEASVPAEAK